MSITADSGEFFWSGKQSYRVVGYRPHEKADGTRRMLTELCTRCADCGEVFFVAAPNIDGYLSRRCAAHKRPGHWTTKRHWRD